MAFMEPQIEFGLWYVVDHDHRDFIPVDVVGALPLLNKLGDTIDLDSEEANVPNEEGETPADAIRAALKDYVDTTHPERITGVELREGYGARFSAPGYMDRTDWSLFDTEEEAAAFLKEEMGEEPDEEEDFEEGNRTEANDGSTWEVIADNIGTVYSGTDETEARETFATYCRNIADGSAGWGLSTGVVLFWDGDIEEEWVNPSAPRENPENLDGMMVESLSDWIDNNPDHPAIAYGRVKLDAMRARLAGDIPRALALEEDCERIYNALPEAYRW